MTKALIPGTYDPVTLGHIDVIKRSAQIFNEIVVGVAASPKKGAGPMFTLDERVAFLKDALREQDNCKVLPFTSLLVDFATEVGATVIVKGLRVVTDFESEFQQAALNYQLNPNLETLFVMANPENMYLSSSMVKEVASMRGDTSDWVTPLVQQALNQRLFGLS
ncbi:MAG: pantetheine-phosphate adenylyltransferase [Coriobacteriales bacterium]|jgi:pantetheine-phosphate adenylyltransferase|nr:pantetheine-phosphate adenylyltransferase [Coriobacteriales bacterium]